MRACAAVLTASVALTGFLSGLGEDAIAAEGPGYLFSTYFGGSDAPGGPGDSIDALARDAAGNVYVAGTTQSLDLPVTPGAFDTVYDGADEIVRPVEGFLAKFDPTLARLLWCTFLGGIAADRITALAVDSAGRPVVTGRTFSPNFPITGGDAPLAGTPTTFVTKLAADGSSLVWSRAHAGRGGTAIGIDGLDRVYVAGTANELLPATTGSFDPTFNGGLFDAYVARLDGDGAISWASFLGGENLEEPFDLLVDPLGDLVLVGYTASAGFPTTTGAHDRHLDGLDAWVARVTAAGNQLAWSTFLGGSSSEQAQGVALVGGAGVLVAGITDSDDFPTTPGAYDRVFAGVPDEGLYDAFLVRMNLGTGALERGTYLGGFFEDFGRDVEVISNQVALVGTTYNDDFPLLGPNPDPVIDGPPDGFVSVFDADLAQLSYSAVWGGRYRDDPTRVAASGRALLIAGVTGSDDYPTTFGAFDPSFNSPSGGILDGFITSLRPMTAAAVPPEAVEPGPAPRVRAWSRGASHAPEICYFAAQEFQSTEIEIWNAAGQRVWSLRESGYFKAGEHRRTWPGRLESTQLAPSGIYLARIRAGDETFETRLVLLR